MLEPVRAGTGVAGASWPIIPFKICVKRLKTPGGAGKNDVTKPMTYGEIDPFCTGFK